MTRGWLALGPLAVCVEAPAALWPWPWPLLRRPAPPPAARWRLALRCERSADAGLPGPLRRLDGAYVAPGLRLTPGSPAPGGAPGYRALVQGPTECMAALAAALVDLGQREPLAVAHGALLAAGERGLLVLGPSGAGKSTRAARHPLRAHGANAALLWPSPGGGIGALALPITGHGDAAVRLRPVRLVGGLWLGESRHPSPGRALGRWVSALASAQGGAPPGLWAELARLPLRGPPPPPSLREGEEER